MHQPFLLLVYKCCHCVVFVQSDVEMLIPAQVGDYTDFYASRHHATNVGSMYRGPGNELNPNW